MISILQEFAARRINLSNLISRPTKRGGLGDYCFVIYAEAHIDDELMADVLRELHAKQGAVKFFGSYPAAGERADERPRARRRPLAPAPTTGSPPSAAASSAERPDPELVRSGGHAIWPSRRIVHGHGHCTGAGAAGRTVSAP